MPRDVREFEDVTEVPGLPVSRIQLDRTYHRYQTALGCVHGRDVLEVACGAGQGLGYLGQEARRVVGGDRTASNLALARQATAGRVQLVRLDAQALPFASARFDAVVMLEALYYLPDARAAIGECRRVLRAGGILVLSTVNRAWPDFGRSIRSTRYFDSVELADLLRDAGFAPRVYGAFPDGAGPAARARSLLRRAAMRLRLVPGSLRAKALVKRFFYGPLLRQPRTLDPAVRSSEPLVPIPLGTRDTHHSILYAVATRDA